MDITVRAKINLYLRVGARRSDGYHSVESLMLPLPPGGPEDTLRLRPRAEAGLNLICAALPPGEPNTVSKAYEVWSRATGEAPGLEAELIKGIPHGAGLGGGSADAAALLLHLQSLSAHPLNAAALNAVAAAVGADVPFFLNQVPAQVSGIGEIISPCPSPVAGLYGLLVCPGLRVNTAWAYGALDRARSNDFLTAPDKPGTKRVSSVTCSLWLENSFEPVVFAAHPQLARLKTALARLGAAHALMSGSGSSLFGLFRKREQACRAAGDLASLPVAQGCALYGPLVF